MSSNPLVPSFRYPWQSQISRFPPEHQEMLTSVFNSLTDLYTANQVNAQKISALKSGATNTATTNNVTTASETTIITSNTVGVVNNQTGVTAYTTGQVDAGAFIILGDTSAVAVNLSTGPAIQTPWYAFLFNENTGLVTATPASGAISFPGSLSAANMTIPQNFGAVIAFDGANFWAVLFPIPPANTPQIAHQWINSFNQITGVFGQSQPAFTDISGTVAPSQLPNPSLTTLGGVEANTPVAHEWVNAINTSGVPQLSQPAVADVTGAAPIASPTFTGVVTQPDSTVLTAATTATSATAGAASALPATPQLYLEVSVNGTILKIPAYSV